MAKGFIKSTQAELKKVVWPTKQQVVKNTLMVLGLVAIIAVVVLVIDLVLKAGDASLWNFIAEHI